MNPSSMTVLYLNGKKVENCCYDYLCPSLLNTSLVMYMMHNERFEEFPISGSTVNVEAFPIRRR